MATPELLSVGRVRKPHGIRGELVVDPLTDTPDAIFASGCRLFVGTVQGKPDPAGRELHIRRGRRANDGWILEVEEIRDRTEAERWRDLHLLLPSDELSPLEEGEVYLHDLVGMRVEEVSGAPVGTVADVYELPQGLLLEITGERQGALIPFSDEVVRSVDAEARLIVVDPPAGLFE
jgi:16S rRNA processing protein RimM